jgi:hypothetical protein
MKDKAAPLSAILQKDVGVSLFQEKWDYHSTIG